MESLDVNIENMNIHPEISFNNSSQPKNRKACFTYYNAHQSIP